MTGVLIFSEILVAGCAFLIYFMYALWRESRQSKIKARVRISKLMPNSSPNVLQFHRREDVSLMQKRKI